MSESKNANPNHYKALIYGMGTGLLIAFAMGHLLDDAALGLVFGLGIGAYLTYDRLDSAKR